MFDKVDKEIEAWVREAIPDAAVAIGPPQVREDKATVGLYLLDAIPEAARMPAPQPLQIYLRYLVTTSGPDAIEAPGRLGELMFAAMNHANWEVEKGGNDPGLWTALGIPPQPAFRLRVPVRFARTTRKAPLVHSPLEIQGAKMSPVHGVVVGPGGVGIADARVEWVDMNLWTRTDPRGQFGFPAAPPLDSASIRLEVKGRVLVIPGKDLPRTDRGVEIRVTNLEA